MKVIDAYMLFSPLIFVVSCNFSSLNHVVCLTLKAVEWVLTDGACSTFA